MNKLFKKLNLSNVLVFSPKKIYDNRGSFFENFNNNLLLSENNFNFKIVQENISISKKHVLRGLHFQKHPFSQGKIISVMKGKILDVFVDIRPASRNFSKWESYILDDELNESLFIPEGFAHGFLGLSDINIVSYKVNNNYNPKFECSILWNDKTLNINWPINDPILSSKDRNSISFQENLNQNNFLKNE